MTNGEPLRDRYEDDLLWLGVHSQEIQDPSGRLYDNFAGMFEPQSLPEFGPAWRALERNTKAAKLRTFVAVCPDNSHALIEVFPPGVLFSHHFVRGDWNDAAVWPADRRRDVELGRSRIETPQGARAKTVPAAALLDELTQPLPQPRTITRTSYGNGRDFVTLRCCITVNVDPRWVASVISEGSRRAVVPASMLARVGHEEVEAETDAEERDTPPR